MTPKQFRKFLEENERSTKEAVQMHVNGKIDDMRSDLCRHIKEHKEQMDVITPIIQAYQGGRVLGNGVKWLACVSLAYLALKGLWK